MKKTRLQENEFRSLVRTEISKIIKEEEGNTQEVPQEEPKAKGKEQDRGESVEKITSVYVRGLKNSLQQLTTEEMADAFNLVMDHFGLGRDGKMEVLRTIKNSIQD